MRKKGGKKIGNPANCRLFLTFLAKNNKCSLGNAPPTRYPTVDLIFLVKSRRDRGATLIRMHIPTNRNCRTRNAAP